jgi:hypothetical protein
MNKQQPLALPRPFPRSCRTNVKRSCKATISLGAPSVVRRLREILNPQLALLLCFLAVSTQAATVAYWKFDAANPTADSSGNANDLAFNGNITLTNEVPTNAPGSTTSAVFDGSSYAQTIGTLDLSPYNAITIEFFAKFSAGMGRQMFLDMNDPNVFVGAFYFDMNEASPTELKVSQKGTAGFQTDVAPYPADGAWHHYALTMDESGANPVIKIYVDGLQVDTGGQPGGIQPFINDLFTIGAFGNLAYTYQGLMDDMRVSFGILTPDKFLSGPATLQISVVGGSAVISWPANAGHFTLDQTDILGDAWTAVTNGPVLSGLAWQVTVPASAKARFFRLIH